jgi:hypothetical protein
MTQDGLTGRSRRALLPLLASVTHAGAAIAPPPGNVDPCEVVSAGDTVDQPCCPRRGRADAFGST